MSTSSGTPYSGEIEEISQTDDLSEISAIVQRFSARSPGGVGGELYSGLIDGTPGGQISKISTSQVATDLTRLTTTPTVDRTPRGQFLGNPDVSNEIRVQAAQIAYDKALAAGTPISRAEADKVATDYIYGDATVPNSVENALWGQNSKEYVGSLSGDVGVLATGADMARTYGAVEFKAAMANPDITSLGGVSKADLNTMIAQDGGDITRAVSATQDQFRMQAAHELFIDGKGNLIYSKEFADQKGMTGPYESAATLEATPGMRAASNVPVGPYPALALAPGELRMLPDEDRRAILAPDTTTTAPGDGALVPGGSDTPSTGDTDVVGEAGKLPLGKIVNGLGNAATIAQTLATIYTTDQQYTALEANGNTFAADNLVRTQTIDTIAAGAGSWAGGAAAGAGYAAIGGAETGPGDIVIALAGGIVGGVVGKAFGGDIAEYFTERDLKLNDGTDGKTYQYLNGSWQTTHSWYDAFASDSPAPAEQIPHLELERATKITELALQHSANLDPNTIQAKDDAGTQVTWHREPSGQWTGFSGDAFKLEQASPKVAGGLEQQSVLRTAIGPNTADFAAKSFVTEYYGKHWDAVGPMPESVVTQLKPDLKSETNIVDPVTGTAWKVDGNDASRLVLTPNQRTSEITVHPAPAELTRVLATRDDAVASNAAYGKDLILQQFTALKAAASVGVPYIPGTTTLPAPTPATPAPFIGPLAYGEAAQGRPAIPAPQTGPATLQPGQPGFVGPTIAASTARYDDDSDDLTTVAGALQHKLAMLRAGGTNLPDVTSVEPYTSRTQTGTFVQVSPGTVAQHLGRGAYQVASVSRDLGGVVPPLGQPVTISPAPTQTAASVAGAPPAVSTPAPPVVTPLPTHSYGRMM